MHKLSAFLPFFTLLCNFIVLLSLHLQTVNSTLTGFSLNLIHVDSRESPLYPGKLSDLQRFHRLLQLPKSQDSYFNNISHKNEIGTKSIINPTTIRPPGNALRHLFILHMNLGSNSTPVSLLLDTGSNFVWTQCQPCKSCFRQNAPVFDPRNSRSYRKLLSNHRFAPFFNCTNGRNCTYSTRYNGGGFSKGVVSVETFSLKTHTGGTERVNNVVFGCGHENSLGGTDYKGGMTGSQSSSLRRFSYCLYEILNPTRTGGFLRFGNDIVIPNQERVRKTPFLSLPNSSRYVVRILDISIGRYRLNVKSGPCIVDSGYGASAIEQKSYSAMLSFLIRHFDQFNLQRIRDSRYKADLCYNRTRNFSNFPTMTFHFQDDDLEIVRTSLFLIRPQYFCLAMRGETNQTVLGAFQQRNVRFVFDLGEDKLLFLKEDCSRDGN
ncbi:hypothetical protein DH2020_034153 [Rehmannia glutinosa]|uniref:Peptidase A1 domain-containing protein n=1 Tax=Rehmannia glutinosa TaxID=99300 RepID=A0ABR0VDG0_REHGL